MIQSFLLVSPYQMLRPIPINLDLAAARPARAPEIKCITGSIDLTTAIVNCVIGDITA